MQRIVKFVVVSQGRVENVVVAVTVIEEVADLGDV
jgi:hypothetical protein